MQSISLPIPGSDQIYAYINDFILMKLLGKGYNSKVKLGYHIELREHFALKIIRHDSP